MPQGDTCTIGAGVTVNGRLTGSAEVNVLGRVEGSIVLENQLVVDQGGEVVAEVEARTLTVRGKLNGDVVAHEVVTLEAGSIITGNIRAPRIIIEEGARFKGNIDMDVQAG